ncbi:ABC transporter permease [Candidatus Woesearchaeota archaeon]|nr:ABC transporter permease [Candidatus Woesearchaeota archaeon]
MAENKRKHDEKLIDIVKIGAIIKKNAIVLSRDKTRYIPLLMFPIFMILVFGYTTGNIPKHIPAAIVPYDHSQLSQEIQQEIANSEVFAIRYVVSTEGEARALLDKGKVKTIVEIPPHLQEDIDAGRQATITVIVDESDSAIAQTSKQTLSTIVGSVSARISSQKLATYQQTVGVSAAMLEQYIGKQPDTYSSIESAAETAGTAMAQSKKLTDDSLAALIRSSPVPVLYVPFNRHTTLNETNTFQALPTAYYATKSKIATYQQTSALAGAAGRSAAAAKAKAGQAAQATSALKASEDKLVRKPLLAISAFTHSSTKNTLIPLVYQEKPAYGTGKRPVDFAIPAIIALTIFQGAIMGMGRAIAGEKREGSLTRVFLTPTSNATILIGTLLFYIAFEMLRSTFILLVAMTFFNIHIEGSLIAIAIILAVYAAVSTGIGMTISTLVKTEQQFMGMAMLVSMPTIFLSGAFFPVQAMPAFLQGIANFLPVTYAADALRGVMIKGFSISLVAYPLAILLVFLTFTILALSAAFRRDIE